MKNYEDMINRIVEKINHDFAVLNDNISKIENKNLRNYNSGKMVALFDLRTYIQEIQNQG
jgi:hypothetical protein